MLEMETALCRMQKRGTQMSSEIKKLVSISSWLIALQIASLTAFSVVTGILYTSIRDLGREIRNTNSASGISLPATSLVENWREYVRPHNAIRGPVDAPIVVMEFTDFQCPFCRSFSETTREQLLSRHGDGIKYVLKHFPLEQIHEHARYSARIAQCAGREGKFWEAEALLFRNQSNLSEEFFTTIDKKLGLESNFDDCLLDLDVAAEVEQDFQDGLQIGIRGTPTFVINGKIVSGAVPLDKWEALFEEARNSR